MKHSARDLSIGGLFGALGVVIPVLFHFVGQGSVFLPMHLPILICGLLVSVPVAFAVGVVTPLISSALTGMPPIVSMAVLMTLELGALAAAGSLFYRKMRLPLIPSVVLALVAARVVGGLERVALGPVLGLTHGAKAYLIAQVVVSWPGLVLQLVLAPIVIGAINQISPVRPKKGSN